MPDLYENVVKEEHFSKSLTVIECSLHSYSRHFSGLNSGKSSERYYKHDGSTYVLCNEIKMLCINEIGIETLSKVFGWTYYSLNYTV